MTFDKLKVVFIPNTPVNFIVIIMQNEVAPSRGKWEQLKYITD